MKRKCGFFTTIVLCICMLMSLTLMGFAPAGGTAVGAADEQTLFPIGNREEIYVRGIELMKHLEGGQDFLDSLADLEEDVFADYKEAFERYCDCDLGNPEKIFKINLDYSGMKEEWEKSSEGLLDSDNIPDGIARNYFADSLNLSNLNQLFMLDQGGMSVSKLATIFPCLYSTISFAQKPLAQPESYLYIYKNSFPVQITFYPGEDDTVYANINVIVAEDFPASEQGIKEYHAKYFGNEIFDSFDLEEMELK